MKHCLKEPDPAIYEAARILRVAVDAHLAGSRDEASTLFQSANMPEVRAWTESIWGKGWKALVQPKVVEGAPVYLPKEQRVPVRMPTRDGEATIIARDGYHCRFCGIPVIHRRVRDRAVRLYPEVVQWGSTNVSQHAAFQALWLQFDHILPHSRGGDNRLENVVITCAPCNYGRFHYTVEELDLIHPLEREPTRSDWNGLEDFA